MKHGKFKIKYQNGESYVGDYRNNKKHGRGVYIYSNTESYTGEYRNGKKHGQGIYRFKNGIEKRGLWSEDTLIENPLSGHGKSVISRGISYKSSICIEQNEKEDDDVVPFISRNISDQSLSLSSSFMNSSVTSSRMSTPPSNRIISRGNPHSNSPHRSRKTMTVGNSASSPSRRFPSRDRSCSDGSDRSSSPSVVSTHRHNHQSSSRRTTTRL